MQFILARASGDGRDIWICGVGTCLAVTSAGTRRPARRDLAWQGARTALSPFHVTTAVSAPPVLSARAAACDVRLPRETASAA